MDILVLILLFVLYVVPEILRRTRKPKKYEYPEFPAEQAEDTTSIEQDSMSYNFQPVHTITPVTTTLPGESPVTSLTAPKPEQPLASDDWAYGYVMAEILGPPKCKINKRLNR